MTIQDDYHSSWLFEARIKQYVEVLQNISQCAIPLCVRRLGYAFTWGKIIERREGLILVWDFYMEELFNGASATAILCIQSKIINELEILLDCVCRNPIVGQLPDNGTKQWIVIPGGIGQRVAFSVACSAVSELDARGWVLTELIPSIIPQMMDALSSSREAA